MQVNLHEYMIMQHFVICCLHSLYSCILISLARAVAIIHKSSHITCNPGVKSLHWLNINERIEYKRFALTHTRCPLNYPLPSLHISITSFLFNCLATFALHMLSVSFEYQLLLFSIPITASIIFRITVSCFHRFI